MNKWLERTLKLLLCVAGIGLSLWNVSAGTTSLLLRGTAGDPIVGARTLFFTPTNGAFVAERVNDGARVLTASWDLIFVPPIGAAFSVGHYPDAQGGPFPKTVPTMAVSGESRGCAHASGSYTVKQFVTNASGGIVAFWATFEQACEGYPSGLKGDVRWNADVPLLVWAPPLAVARITQPFVLDVSAFATNGGPVTLTAESLPPGAQFTQTGSNAGQLSWVPTSAQIGFYEVAFTATNSTGDSETMYTRLGVKPMIPANDEITNARAFAQVPFTEAVDTSEASINNDPMCVTATRAVWYAFTPAQDITVEASTEGSEFIGGLSVFTGAPGSLVSVNCAANRIRFRALSNTTYYIQAGTLSGSGSNLLFRLEQAADVKSFGVYKGNLFVQRGAESRPMPLRSVFVAGLDNDSEGQVAFVDLTDPNGYHESLAPEPGNSFSGGVVFRSRAALERRFPAGDYTFLIGAGQDGTNQFTITLPESEFPAPARINNWRAAQFYKYDYGMMLTWDAIAGARANDAVQFQVVDREGDLVHQTPAAGEPGAMPGTATSVLIPERLLAAGEPFVGIVTFTKLTTLDRTTYPGAVMTGGFTSTVGFPIRVLSRTVRGAGTVGFTSSRYVVSEHGTMATISVLRRGGHSEAVTVDYATTDGSASSGSDYTSVSGTLTFAAGETSKTFTIPLLTDTEVETEETVNLTLSNVGGGARLGLRKAALLIRE